MPIGMPGWPDLAFCTASIASARMRVDMIIAERGSAGMRPLIGFRRS